MIIGKNPLTVLVITFCNQFGNMLARIQTTFILGIIEKLETKQILNLYRDFSEEYILIINNWKQCKFHWQKIQWNPLLFINSMCKISVLSSHFLLFSHFTFHNIFLTSKDEENAGARARKIISFLTHLKFVSIIKT